MIKYYNGEMYIIPNEFEEEVRADERQKCKEEFKQALKRHWLNGTVAHRIIDEILADYEKEQKGERNERRGNQEESD